MPISNNETFQIEDTPPNPQLSRTDWRRVLKPLASLKITVTLLALSIVLVLVGTLAQVDSGIWEVVADYFRCWFLWLEIKTTHRLFEPYVKIGNLPSWVGIPFPGGYTIGLAMLINLVAAHTLRFTVQAKGLRLWAGLLVTLLGVLVTWGVIESGHADSGLQDTSLQWDFLWSALQGGLFVVGCLTAVGLGLAVKSKKPEVIPLSIALLGIVVGLLAMFAQGGRGIDDSGMRILWQLMKGTASGLVLLVGCVLLFRKRAGVVVLHAGVILMLIHEPIVGSKHIETQMRLVEGESTNFAEDHRTVELVLVNSTPAEHNEEVTVSREKLLSVVAKSGSTGVISDPLLPVDIRVIEYMKNSRPADDEAKAQNRATAGTGLSMVLEKADVEAGTDSEGRVDMPSAYVELLDRKTQKSLGTYAVSSIFAVLNNSSLKPNVVAVEGVDWEVGMRFKRYYKPYSLKLLDVSKTDYAGTDTPRDYRSIVRVVQEAKGDLPKVDFERPIWMNNPMRYSGETYYQTSYAKDPRSGKEQTTLSVVLNTGWMIPYVACMIGAVGMLAHFWVVLVRFVARRFGSESISVKGLLKPLADLIGLEAVSAAPQLKRDDESSLFAKCFPWFVAALVGLFLLGRAKLPTLPDKQADYRALGNLPVLYEGRFQPIDTLARNKLKLLSQYTTFKDEDGARQSASMWLLDMIVLPKKARDHKVFRIDHPDLLEKLKLDPKRSGFKYALNEFAEQIPALIKDADEARKKDGKNGNDRTAYDRRVLELERRIGVIDLIDNSFQILDVDDLDLSDEKKGQAVLMGLMRALDGLDRRQPPLLVPPTPAPKEHADIKDVKPEWRTFTRAWIESQLRVKFLGMDPNKPVELFADILREHLRVRRAQAEVAELKKDGSADARTEAREKLAKASTAFNEKVSEYRRWLVNNAPEGLDLDKTSFESWFNHYDPFFWSMLCYIGAFLMSLVALMGWSKPLNRAAFMTILVTFIVHSIALQARIYISGRPPVTNLYSSAVFIGWGALILAMLFEIVFRLGIGNILGSALGAASLGIAGVLGAEGDTIKVMQAVLDTQFWLWTHVTCITLGYSVTFVAGFLGLLYVFGGRFGNMLTPSFEKDLTRVTYGSVCFGIFFSFVGTVLGGLWADDSWGRFWGWDPKENGALIIVLWNALVMHARWDGMVKARGFALLCIGGNIVTSWSWFGVNELGVGLHAYGFTEGVWFSLWMFWLSQLVCIGIGLTPLTAWKSFRDRSEVASVEKTDLLTA